MVVPVSRKVLAKGLWGTRWSAFFSIIIIGRVVVSLQVELCPRPDLYAKGGQRDRTIATRTQNRRGG